MYGSHEDVRQEPRLYDKYKHTHERRTGAEWTQWPLTYGG